MLVKGLPDGKWLGQFMQPERLELRGCVDRPFVTQDAISVSAQLRRGSALPLARHA